MNENVKSITSLTEIGEGGESLVNTIEQDFIAKVDSFTSFNAETHEDKIKFYNMIANPKNKVSANINQVIKLKNIYVELVTLKTGELVPRIILMDDKNEGYHCVSLGVYGALKRIFSIFGTPNEWNSPLPVKIVQLESDTNRIFTLEVVK